MNHGVALAVSEDDAAAVNEEDRSSPIPHFRMRDNSPLQDFIDPVLGGVADVAHHLRLS